jgi:hypothetical protein
MRAFDPNILSGAVPQTPVVINFLESQQLPHPNRPCMPHPQQPNNDMSEGQTPIRYCPPDRVLKCCSYLNVGALVPLLTQLVGDRVVKSQVSQPHK